jgi:hypothetical protein
VQSQREQVETVPRGVVYFLAVHDDRVDYRAYRVRVPVPGTLPTMPSQTVAKGARRKCLTH